MDTRALGVSASQREAESMWLAFSPRLLRSTVALVGQMMSTDRVLRNEAMKVLGLQFSSTAGFYVISGIALGKNWEQIGEG